MATNVNNVVAGKPVGGGVWRAPRGSVLPTDATTLPGAPFAGAGYIGEDGLTETQDRSTEKIRAWGGDTVKVVQTEFGLTFEFTFIESIKGEVLEAVYGKDNVTSVVASASKGNTHAVKVTSDQLPHEAYIFDVKDGDAHIRIVVPDGQITEVGEVTYSDGEVVGYQVTIEAFRDVDLGAQAIKYIDDGQKTD